MSEAVSSEHRGHAENAMAPYPNLPRLGGLSYWGWLSVQPEPSGAWKAQYGEQEGAARRHRPRSTASG